MSLTVHLALVFHVFIAVAVMVMVCGHRGLWPSWLWPLWYRTNIRHTKRHILSFNSLWILWHSATHNDLKFLKIFFKNNDKNGFHIRMSQNSEWIKAW